MGSGFYQLHPSVFAGAFSTTSNGTYVDFVVAIYEKKTRERDFQ